MGTIHKRTYRPLALIALFILLGIVGWQLPHLGAAALTYSNQAMKAARATVGDALGAKSKVSPKAAGLMAVDNPTADQLKIVRMMLADLSAGGEYSREEQYLLNKVKS